jgi:hypothetical protein
MSLPQEGSAFRRCSSLVEDASRLSVAAQGKLAELQQEVGRLVWQIRVIITGIGDFKPFSS